MISIDGVEPSIHDETGPDYERAGKAFVEFCRTVAALRHPKFGCPWDLRQNHKLLVRFLLEESYEAAEAMMAEDRVEIAKELGDVLLQVVLNAQVGKDEGHFDIITVIEGINQKMRRRHPHVFAQEEYGDEASHRQRWHQLKAEENSGGAKTVFSKISVRAPATIAAYEIGKRAREISFDWNRVQDVWKQFQSEVVEVDQALTRSQYQSSQDVEDELGDVYFSLAQVCRHLELDPEVVALQGNRKFLTRFAKMERLADQTGINLSQCGQGVLERLWLEAKKMKQKTVTP